MSTPRHGNTDGPEDIDARFAEIVADLEGEVSWGDWPEQQGERSTDDASTPRTEQRTGAGGSEEETAAHGPREQAEHPAGPRDWVPGEEDEGHYEPPEPPPLGAPRPRTVGGFAIILLGFLLLAVPGLLGAGSTVALPLGLVAISGGIAWLLFGLRQGPKDVDDDGAQL